MIGLATLSWVALALLGYPALVGVLQLVFASVAGAGALVALVMAYRRQRVAETATAHDRTRVLNERFTAIAGQLGDAQAAVRLAGVHAMAGLADDWPGNRQTCVDVLCAYLRMPYEPDPGERAGHGSRLVFLGNREVRHTVIRVITAYLREDAGVSWQGLDFDFTGAVFDGGDFYDAEFSGGTVRFSGAGFAAGEVTFNYARFSGADVMFYDASFSGAKVRFDWAAISGGTVSFIRARFSAGAVTFGSAEFTGGQVRFDEAQFTGGTASFDNAEFSGSDMRFDGALFGGGGVDFSRAADWTHPPGFEWKDAPPAGIKLPAATGDDAQ